MFQKKKISILIPTLNEAKNLPIVLKSLPKYVDEVIVIDGYSKDQTDKIAKKAGCKVIYDKKGKGSALRLGLKKAKGDIIVMMDADCSHLSSEIVLLISGILAGYDICMGSRFIQGGGSDDISLIRVIGNKIFVHTVNLLWGTNYTDLCYGYRSFTKDAIKKLDLSEDGFGIETEISIQSAKKKIRILEVPSFEKHRQSGEGKLRTIIDGWRIAKTILKELFLKKTS